MSTARRYNIDEIALAAGVSKATVSRVMNGTAPVSEAKKKVVESTIGRLGYQPNQNAQKLAGGFGGSIAMVLEESTEEFFLNPFWKSVVQGFIAQASLESLHPVIFFHSKHGSDQELVNALIRGNYDGVAIFGWHRDIKIFERYVPKNMIIVFGGYQGKSKRFTSVGVDNEQGGYLATQHLIEQGCTKILTITGDLSIQSARERLSGYRRAIEEAGIAPKSNRILESDFTKENAEITLRNHLKKGTQFDGIFAGNDLMALGALKVLQEEGFEIPGDVKLIGFDGSELAKKSSPSITSIAQPSHSLGSSVVKNLAMALRRKSISSMQLEVTLEKGQTT